MKLTPSVGIGTQLQVAPGTTTPSQAAMQQLMQTAQKLDDKGFIKLADKIDDIIVEFGEDGLDNSHQQKFPKTTPCKHCDGEARIAFTLMETGENWEKKKYICDLHKNRKNSMWLHDCGAFAVYLCKKCLEPSALYNQA